VHSKLGLFIKLSPCQCFKPVPGTYHKNSYPWHSCTRNSTRKHFLHL